MMTTNNYRSSEIIERKHFFAWCNREEVTHVCQSCLAVVPDPDTGCHHCKKKRETKHARLQQFLQSKQEVENCDDLI